MKILNFLFHGIFLYLFTIPYLLCMAIIVVPVVLFISFGLDKTFNDVFDALDELVHLNYPPVLFCSALAWLLILSPYLF